MKKKFYITTAIAYTSRKPHIGNTYEIVLADSIARFKRLLGYDVFFLTGTDEHGQKIEELAKSENVSPKQYVDKIAAQIRSIWDLMDSSYDKFIRTTDKDHELIVQKIFKKLYNKGDIYKGEYKGLYCTPCESFWTESQLKEGKCPDCERDVKETKEEAYFFKMSKYQKKLMDYIESHPEFIQPESRKNEMINTFLKPGLQDLCVSRTSFKWGIPVDFDTNHVVYVWIDALSNYITALGYNPELDNQPELYNKYWPADIHVIGKDILRFHTIYWPIMLMALDIPLPKQVVGHPWLLSGFDKMSKSKGNVMYADDLVSFFGVDAIRYYLLTEMSYSQDGTITYEAIISKFNSDLANTLGNLVNRTISMVDAIRYYLLTEMSYSQDGTITYEAIISKFNSDLANTLGNLVNRTISMIIKYFDGIILKPIEFDDIDQELKDSCINSVKEYTKFMNEYKTSDAISCIMNLARRSNKYIDETMPWILAKDEKNKNRLQTVLYNLLESIRFIAVMLNPIMPSTSQEIFNQINSHNKDYDSILEFGKTYYNEKVCSPSPIFSRIDEKKKLDEIFDFNNKSNDIDGVCIEIDDFSKVKLKVAKIVECEKIEKSDKLLKLKLNDGTSFRQVVSGIAQYYNPQDLLNKKVIIVSNLKPIKLRGVESHGMILASETENGDIKVIFLDDDIKVGAFIK